MQGIVSGGLLVVAFVAVAGLALLAAARLYRISRPGQPRGASPRASVVASPEAGRAGEPPDA